jgi:predicted NUDIX family NTP pyrophosphohydrolase
MRVRRLSSVVCRLLMAKLSAGILLYRGRGRGLELLLVHPGGPFWAKKDAGAWSIPKGEYAEGEDALAAARRELAEEIGAEPRGALLPLGDIVQKGGKRVSAWALEGDFDPARLKSNHFELEWPPRSGRRQSFPEVDRAQWFAPDAARQKILPAQADFIGRLLKALGP